MIAYFDTSAFVKLVIDETGRDVAAHAWVASRPPVASMLLYPEAAAAVSAASRAGRIDDLLGTRARIDAFVAQVAFVRPARHLLWRAGALTAWHPLRAYDAVHLATALALGPLTSFVTADKRLATAARAEGLLVVEALVA